MQHETEYHSFMCSCGWRGLQDIHVQEFFWLLLLSTLFKDDGNALTTTNAGRANRILASSSPVEKTSYIIQSYLM